MKLPWFSFTVMEEVTGIGAAVAAEVEEDIVRDGSDTIYDLEMRERCGGGDDLYGRSPRGLYNSQFG
jgi:hypothetical protein